MSRPRKRQRRRLLGEKCPTCRAKALTVIKDTVTCLHCGAKKVR